MKEFYLYTLTNEYIEKFSGIEPRLLLSKGVNRPAICLKDNKGQSWLLPVTSLDPLKPNYPKKIQIINAQTKQEQNMKVKAIMRFPDVTGQKVNLIFESVVLFYNILPVKDKYVNEFAKESKHLAAQLDTETLNAIKRNFKLYMSGYFNGKPAGFLLRYAKSGADVSKYQYKAKEIYRQLKHEEREELEQKQECNRIKESLLVKQPSLAREPELLEHIAAAIQADEQKNTQEKNNTNAPTAKTPAVQKAPATKQPTKPTSKMRQ